MNIMVSGIGGIGGYIASVLCAHESDVTLVARRKRRQSLEKNGLILHSLLMGERVFHPAVTDTPASAGIQDMIFICTKTFSLVQALQDVIPCIGPATIVVPMMNGVDHDDITRRTIPCGIVVNTVIFVTCSYRDDYSIDQKSRYARLLVSSPGTAGAAEVAAVLNHDGELECTAVADLRPELWHKFILTCAYNTITAYYGCTTRGLAEHPERLQQFRTLIREAYAVARAGDVPLDESVAEDIYDQILHRRSLDDTSSTARDFLAHRPSELETFGGTLLRYAARWHVSVPLSESFYTSLWKKESSYRENP